MPYWWIPEHNHDSHVMMGFTTSITPTTITGAWHCEVTYVGPGCLPRDREGSMSHMVWPVPPKWRPRMDPADQVEYPIGVGHNLGKNCMEEFWLSSVCVLGHGIRQGGQLEGV